MLNEIKNAHNPQLDLLEVGEQKPLGSLPEDIFATREDLQLLFSRLDNAGIAYQTVNTPVVEGTRLIMAFSLEHLSKLLQEESSVLRANHWPIDAAAFATRVASETVYLDSPVFDIISRAYGNDPREVREAIRELSLRYG